jgi:branched-chain amino acid transport system ATP-binding protein
MLAIARVLRAGAPLLLLDEPTEGLAPALVKQIGEIIRLLARSGITVLLVEQNFHFASSVADRHYVLERGKVVDALTNEEITQNTRKLEAYLAV